MKTLLLIALAVAAGFFIVNTPKDAIASSAAKATQNLLALKEADVFVPPTERKRESSPTERKRDSVAQARLTPAPHADRNPPPVIHSTVPLGSINGHCGARPEGVKTMRLCTGA